MSEKIEKALARNISRLLEEQNKSQKELADYLGVSSAAVNNYITGKNSPRLDKIDALCSFFGVTRNELLNLNHVSFDSAEEAVRFLLSQNVVMGYNGLDIRDLSEEEQMDFANEVLSQIGLVAYKFKDRNDE